MREGKLGKGEQGLAVAILPQFASNLPEIQGYSECSSTIPSFPANSQATQCSKKTRRMGKWEELTAISCFAKWVNSGDRLHNYVNILYWIVQLQKVRSVFKIETIVYLNIGLLFVNYTVIKLFLKEDIKVNDRSPGSSGLRVQISMTRWSRVTVSRGDLASKEGRVKK